jgi:hypothetical protein
MKKPRQMSARRPFTPATIALGGRIIQEVRNRGIVGKSSLGRLFGRTPGSLENILIYITEVEPNIAETDDGKLIWVNNTGNLLVHAGTINITEVLMAAKEKPKAGKSAPAKGKSQGKPEPKKLGKPPKAKV